MSIQQLGYNNPSNIGVLGIMNSQGNYTYYADYTSALQSAKAGDTIVQFANIVEQNQAALILKNGVNLNLNGFIYEFKCGFYFYDNNVAVACSIMNGKIYSGVISNTTSLFIIQNASSVITTNCTIEATMGISSVAVQCNGTWIGGIFRVSTGYAITTGIFSAVGGSGVLINANIYGTVYTGGQSGGGGTLRNCVVVGGIFIVGTVSMQNCVVIGSVTVTGPLTTYNCVFYNSGGFGLYHTTNTYSGLHTNLIVISLTGSGGAVLCGGATFYNCFFYSGAAPIFKNNGNEYGISQLGQFNKFYDCTLITAASILTNSFNDTYVNSTLNCLWNNAGGHSTWYPLSIIKCYLKVANVNAKCVYSPTATIATFVKNTYQGAVEPVYGNVAQSQQNTRDLYGNITIG